MRVFLDASVILAACGRDSGASRRIFDIHRNEGWSLLAGAYVMGEVRINIGVLVSYFADANMANALAFFPTDGQEEATKTLTDAVTLKPDVAAFPRCFKKVKTMARVLMEEQFVSFIC